MDGEILKNSWVDSSLSWYSQLELKPCEHRSLGMDEFVALVAETSVTSNSVLSNHTTVFQGVDERMPIELTASAFGHMCPELIIGCWNCGGDNDLLFTSDYGQDDLDFLYSTFCCLLASVLRLVPVGAECSLCAGVLFFVGDRLGIAVVCFVADHYVLEPFFPFIFEPLASMAVHARSYLSALAVSFKRQPPSGTEEEAHWAHA